MEVVVAAASPSPEFAVVNFGNTPPEAVMTRAFRTETSWTATGRLPRGAKTVVIRSHYSTSRHPRHLYRKDR
jgi:hypothetical protein